MDWFAKHLLDWFDVHGRTDLPWQQQINPYRVWVSEIMLQQTQVATVIDYYNRFMQRFPTVQHLADANMDDVLHLWTGLGYYARARNLYKSAGIITSTHQGEFPQSQNALEDLPGIGRSTAGAIRAIAQGQRATILDGNVKRVLTRFHAIAGYPGVTQVSKDLWLLADDHTPNKRCADYTQAIMDLGATLCTRSKPDCAHCPVASQCQAFAAGETARYPERKPKKEKPVREARFFIVSAPNGMTLLEQRPLSGLWGGLWTPPERAAECSERDLLQELGATEADVTRKHTAPVFRHTFTHFHLDIEPVYLHLKHLPNTVQDDTTRRWIDPNNRSGENQAIGLSAPAVRLLDSLADIFNH